MVEKGEQALLNNTLKTIDDLLQLDDSLRHVFYSLVAATDISLEMGYYDRDYSMIGVLAAFHQIHEKDIIDMHGILEMLGVKTNYDLTDRSRDTLNTGYLVNEVVCELWTGYLLQSASEEEYSQIRMQIMDRISADDSALGVRPDDEVDSGLAPTFLSIFSTKEQILRQRQFQYALDEHLSASNPGIIETLRIYSIVPWDYLTKEDDLKAISSLDATYIENNAQCLILFGFSWDSDRRASGQRFEYKSLHQGWHDYFAQDRKSYQKTLEVMKEGYSSIINDLKGMIKDSAKGRNPEYAKNCIGAQALAYYQEINNSLQHDA